MSPARRPDGASRLFQLVFFGLAPLLFVYVFLDHAVQWARYPDATEVVSVADAMQRDAAGRQWLTLTDARPDCATRKEVGLRDARTYVTLDTPLAGRYVIAEFYGGWECSAAPAALTGRLYPAPPNKLWFLRQYRVPLPAGAAAGNTWALCTFCDRTNAQMVTLMMGGFLAFYAVVGVYAWRTRKRPRRR